MVMRASKLRKAARKMTRLSWGCCGSSTQDIISNIPRSRSGSVAASSGKVPHEQNVSDYKPNNKSLCAICLEALSCWREEEEEAAAAIFTSEECSHAFHLNCIASNVRHGSVSCPICRAQWTHLPRHDQYDPILRILDDSIATLRVHRRSSSTRYDDDDPVHHQHQSILPNNRLQFALLPPLAAAASSSCSSGGSELVLSVKLVPQEATDLVLVVSPSSSRGAAGGPHLRRLLKQAMALVVFSLRCIDRLAIVVTTYSSTSATRVLPLRRMTWHGKRTALQVIDTLFFASSPMGMGHTHTGEEPRSGMKKGIKILEDRTHKNPHSRILHLSCDTTASPGWCYKQHQVHHFHFDVVGMHRFEEFLARAIGGIIRDTHLKIGGEDDGEVVRLGELRGGEERRIPLIINLNQTTQSVSVIFSYIEGEGGVDCFTTGEIQVSLPLPEDKTQSSSGGGRTSWNLVESWDYHDTYMARRWAKHLHGYKP